MQIKGNEHLSNPAGTFSFLGDKLFGETNYHKNRNILCIANVLIYKKCDCQGTKHSHPCQKASYMEEFYLKNNSMPQNQARGPFCDLRLPASGSFSPERPPATAGAGRAYLPRGQLHNRAPSASARSWREGAPQYSPCDDSYVLTADPPVLVPGTHTLSPGAEYMRLEPHLLAWEQLPHWDGLAIFAPVR